MAARPALSRRALLGALGVGAALSACGETQPEKSGPPSTRGPGVRKVEYADDHPDQYGVLGMPRSTPTGLAVLVHGGFWSDRYGAGLMDPMAADLRDRGWATWNIEYRRVGSGGGYPTTYEDVATAYDHVPRLGPGLDALPSVALGHSAGGHLAVWAASRSDQTPGGGPRFTPGSTLALSGVLDLTSAAAEGLGGDPTRAMLGQSADPAELVPATGRVLAVHAEDDAIVPRDQSSTYVRLATAAGGTAQLVAVPGGHFDLIDPRSDAWTKVVALLPAR